MKKYFVPVEYAVCRETYPGWNINWRKISNHELVFIKKGTAYLSFPEKKIVLSTGSLIYFKPDRLHHLATDDRDPAVIYAVHFNLSDDFLPLDEVSQWENINKFFPLLDETVFFWNRKEYLDDWAADLAFSKLLLELLREDSAVTSYGSKQQVKKAIEWIHRHPEQSPTISQLSEIAGMKKSCLIKNFQLMTGQPPIQYSLMLRLEHAKALLLNEEISVRDAAYACGFRDEFYFSRIFRKKYGIPPSKIKARI